MPNEVLMILFNVIEDMFYKTVILYLHIIIDVLEYAMSADNLAYKELLFSCTVVNANMICVLHVKMKRRTNKINKNLNVNKTTK